MDNVDKFRRDGILGICVDVFGGGGCGGIGLDGVAGSRKVNWLTFEQLSLEYCGCRVSPDELTRRVRETLYRH